MTGFGTNAYALDAKYRIGQNLNVKKHHDSWLKCTFPLKLSTSDKLYPPAITSVDWSPTGDFVIATNCHDREFGLWDINTKACIRRFAGHKDCVLAAKYLKKSNTIISGSADWKIKRWDFSTSQEISTFSDGQAESISALAVSADETILLEASSSSKPINLFNKKRHAFRLWNLKTNSLIERFFEHSEPLHANGLAISPDGTMAITAGYDNVVILHKLDGKYVDHIILEKSQFWSNAVCFSPDGRFAVWASDNDVKVWDIKRKCISATLKGHSSIVKCISFHKCGKYLLTGSRDETIKLWDISIVSCVKSFDAPGGDVISLAFSPNCRYAVSGSEQGSISIWEFDWDYETAISPKVEQKDSFFRMFSIQ